MGLFLAKIWEFVHKMVEPSEAVDEEPSKPTLGYLDPKMRYFTGGVETTRLEQTMDSDYDSDDSDASDTTDQLIFEEIMASKVQYDASSEKMGDEEIVGEEEDQPMPDAGCSNTSDESLNTVS